MSIFIKNTAGRYGLAFLLLLWLAPASQLSAQEEEAPPAEEEVEKASSRMGLSTTQYPNDTIELKALLRAKTEGTWSKIGGEKVAFFAVGDEDETPLGEAMTNGVGIAKLPVGTAALTLNSEGYYSFAARFEGNDALEDSEGDVSILPAKLILTPMAEGDSAFTISVQAEAPSGDSIVPLAEADVVVTIRRMVGQLKVGEATTDEDGAAEIGFPSGMAGDDNGNLFINVSIVDFEEYGNVAANTVQAWGRPVSSKIEEMPRSLWSPNPPLWMVITFFVLMAAVWGHYAVVVFKLRQIKKA